MYFQVKSKKKIGPACRGFAQDQGKQLYEIGYHGLNVMNHPTDFIFSDKVHLRYRITHT
jgi:hypothetical protein